MSFCYWVWFWNEKLHQLCSIYAFMIHSSTLCSLSFTHALIGSLILSLPPSFPPSLPLFPLSSPTPSLPPSLSPFLLSLPPSLPQQDSEPIQWLGSYHLRQQGAPGGDSLSWLDRGEAQCHNGAVCPVSPEHACCTCTCIPHCSSNIKVIKVIFIPCLNPRIPIEI